MSKTNGKTAPTVIAADEGLPLIDLDAMVRPVARIKLGGAPHDVWPIRGRGYELMQGIAERAKRQEPTPLDEQVRVLREIIAEVVPTLSAPERQALSLEQMLGIVGGATRQVELVKRMMTVFAGNGRGPTERAARRTRKG